jgi:recombinational DNA repair protein RecR
MIINDPQRLQEIEKKWAWIGGYYVIEDLVETVRDRDAQIAELRHQLQESNARADASRRRKP